MSQISADQEARAKAQTFQRDYRVKIGPPREFVQQGLFTAGQPVSLPSGTTLQTAFDYWAGDRTLDVADVSGYPDSGTLVVQDSAGTSWLEYDSRNTTNDTFNVVAVLLGSGDLGVGATVTQWHDITERVTSWRVDEFEKFPFRNYEVPLEGIRFDSTVMKNDATVIIEERVQAAGSDTGWQLAALCYVPDWNPTGDNELKRRWTVTGKSIKQYIDRTRISARSYGRNNLAAGVTVTDGWSETGQSPINLQDPTLAPEEFAGGLGTTAAGNLVDEKRGTRYVSSFSPTRTAETPGSYTAVLSTPKLIIDEVLLQGGIGSPADLQYIVIKLPDWGPDSKINFDGDEYLLYVYDSSGNLQWSQNIPEDVTLERTGDNDTERIRLILCANRESYEQAFGTAGAAIVREWAPGQTLDTAGGAIHLRQQEYPPSSTSLTDFVAYGAWQSGFFGAGDDDRHWDDTNVVSVPSAGSSIRRVPTEKDSNQASDWQAESAPMPADPPEQTDDVFLSFELPDFTVKLANGISPGSPADGGSLELDDATPLDPSGTIQLPGGTPEQIAYRYRDDTTLYDIERGANGTTEGTFSADTLVYQYDSTNGAHRMPAVESVEWLRTRVLDSNNDPIVPYDLEVWGSTQANPDYPGTASYNDDWIIGRNGSISQTSPPRQLNVSRALSGTLAMPLDSNDRPPRLRHVMLRVHGMKPAGKKLALNEVRIWRWTPPSGSLQNSIGDGTFSGDFGGIELNTGVAKVIVDLLQDVVDPADISYRLTPFLGTNDEWKIRDGMLGNAIEDILTKSMGLLTCELDGRLTLDRDPRHPLRNRPATRATFDDDMMRSPQPVSRPSRLAIAQVVAEIHNPETLQQFVGRYPPSVSNLGEIVQKSLRMRVRSETTAAMIAQAYYLDHPDISDTVSGTTAGPAPWLHAGDAVLMTDYSDEAGTRAFICRITSVSHNDKGVESWEAKVWRIASSRNLAA